MFQLFLMYHLFLQHQSDSQVALPSEDSRMLRKLQTLQTLQTPLPQGEDKPSPLLWLRHFGHPSRRARTSHRPYYGYESSNTARPESGRSRVVARLGGPRSRLPEGGAQRRDKSGPYTGGIASLAFHERLSPVP